MTDNNYKQFNFTKEVYIMTIAETLKNTYTDLDELKMKCQALYLHMFYKNNTDTFSYYFTDNSILHMCGLTVETNVIH